MQHGVYRFYRWKPDPPESPIDEWSVPPEHIYWTPAWHHPLPIGCYSPKFLIWFLFHQLGVFHSKGYAVLLIRRGERVIHRTCVFPRFFRFPFMDVSDLQVGDIWTDPAARGEGLATTALEFICRMHASRNRTLWYLVEEDNRPSVKVAEKNGFQWVGCGTKHPRWGFRQFGYYSIDEPVQAVGEASDSR